MTEDRGLEGVSLDGKYRLDEVIGEGGMGVVYDARQLADGRRVAVKMLRLRHAAEPKSLARFRHEARILRSLRHPHIAEVVDAGVTAQDVPYLVMEYLEGRTLQDLIAEQAPFSPSRAAGLMVQALDALEVVHAADVIHRDIKPHNFFIVRDRDDREHVKLLDFGIARLTTDERQETTSLTDTGQFLGTPHYVSPEQAFGKGITTRSDIYSAGVVLYKMLTGRLPFDDSNRNALIVKILVESAASPSELNPEVSEELAEVVRVAMARNPLHRFAHVGELRRRLIPFAEQRDLGVERGARAPGSADAAAQPPRRVRGVHHAIFVRLFPSETSVALPEGEQVRIRALEDLEELPEAIDALCPKVVVSSVGIDLDALRRRISFFAPLVTVDVFASGQELSIHEWEPERGRYEIRRAPLEELDAILSELCRREEPPRAEDEGLQPEDVESIGFSHQIEKDGSEYHVDTEVVLRRGTPRITTRVWSAGRIVTSQAQSLEAMTAVAPIKHAASAQHEAVIEELLGDTRDVD